MNDSFQDQENKINSRVDDEISLKEIIFKIQEWWSIVWSVKLLILSLSLILGLSSALYTKFLTKPTYTASYQLFFQEESGGLSSAMMCCCFSGGQTRPLSPISAIGAVTNYFPMSWW